MNLFCIISFALFGTLHFRIVRGCEPAELDSASFFSFHSTGFLPVPAVLSSFSSVIASCDKIMFIIIINKSLFNVHRPCYKKVIVQIKITDSSSFCVFLCCQLLT